MRWTRHPRTQHFTHSSNATRLTGSRVRQLTVVCVTFHKSRLIFSYSWTYGSSRRWRRTHCSLCVKGTLGRRRGADLRVRQGVPSILGGRDPGGGARRPPRGACSLSPALDMGLQPPRREASPCPEARAGVDTTHEGSRSAPDAEES